MKLSPTAQKLYDAFSEFDIIDAHEHLPPEKERVAQKQDVFTLFSHYTRHDLISAGMAQEVRDWILDPQQPLDERWKKFAPFLPAIRHSSYARAAFIAAREFYGHGDVTAQNYRELSERIQAANTPGIYQRVLGDKCRIKVALTQQGHTRYQDDPLLKPVPNIGSVSLAGARSWADVEEQAAAFGRRVQSVDDYVEVAREQFRRWKEEGAVGLKMTAQAFSNPSKESAEQAFRCLAEGGDGESPRKNAEHLQRIVSHYLTELCVEMAADIGWTVAVHCGVWGDFRTIDAQLMIPFVQRHPRVRFDLYHLSVPYVRQCAVIAKNLPNVFLNLCWTHIISQRMTCAALDETMDLVPVNKIIAFGGDYSRPVEKVYGHLLMAREDIASVLGRRVDESLLGLDEAKRLAHEWFCENPKRIYGLNV